MGLRSARSRASFGVLSFLPFTLFCLIVAAVPARAQRAVAHVPDVVLSGGAKPTSILAPEEQLRFALILPGRNEGDLDAAIADLYNRQSPNYHHYLSVDEFAERFGPSQADYDTLKGYATAHGFEIIGTPRNRKLVYVRASVADINRALHVTMGEYQHPSEARTFYSPDREPTPDVPLSGVTISGLDNFELPHPGIHHGSQAVPAAAGSGPGGSYIGSDMRAVYYGGTQLTGSGQTVAIFSLDGILTSDLTLYTQKTGMALPVPVSVVNVGGYNGACGPYSGDKGCDDGEQVIDVVSLEGVAPGLSQINFYQDTNPQALLSAIASDTSSTVVSMSWTWSAANLASDHSVFQEMAMQGQTVFHASGDFGAYNSSTYGWPSDEGRIVQVGGTDLTTTGAGGGWSTETAWPHSGGGYIGNVTIPDYQQQAGVITTQNGGSTQYRNSPDVAAEGNGDNYNCTNGVCSGSWYGTSIATPRWAGMVAMANELGAEDRDTAVGYINSMLYELGLNPPANYPLPFHDITSGSNPPSSGTGSTYTAISGYDLVTGWGSPNSVYFIYELLNLPPPDFGVSAAATAVQFAQGSTGTAAITLTTLNGEFVGNVDLSVSGLPAGVTASFSPATANANTGSTLTFTASSTAATGTTTVTIFGSFQGVVRSTTVSITVVSDALQGSGSDFFTFDGTVADGAQGPGGQMVQGSDGKLYGATTNANANWPCIVYSLTLSGKIQVLHAFAGDGSDPLGICLASGVVEAPDGNFYGISEATNGQQQTDPQGGILRISPSGATTLAWNNDGSVIVEPVPYYAPTLGSDGKLYFFGYIGNNEEDFVRVDPATGKLELIAANLVDVVGPALERTPGNFVFTDAFALYNVVASTGAVTVIYNPTTSGEVDEFVAHYAVGADNDLYAVTTGLYGGNAYDGGLLKLSPSNSPTFKGWTFSQNPPYPTSGLVLDPNGLFYTFATTGIYAIDTAADFNPIFTDPSYNELVTVPAVASDGNIYFPSPEGGANGSGTIDVVTPHGGAAPVQLSLSASSVSANTPVKLTWKVLNGFSATLQTCYAYTSGVGGGTWTGKQTGTVTAGVYTGSSNITPTAAGSYTYALTCGGVESGLATLQVNPAGSKSASTTSLTVSPTTVQTGGSVTVTIKVTGSAGTPTGSATLLAGPNAASLSAVGTVALGSNGSITFPASTSGYPAGKYVVEASYAGDSNYQASTSSTVAITISAAKAASTTTVTATPNPVLQNGTITISSTVKGSSPTGTVTYTGSGMTIGSAKVGSNGVVPPLAFPAQAPPGTYTLTASYSGDSANNPSTGTVSVRIAPAVKIVLTATPNPVNEGSNVTLTATLSGVGSSAVPTGTVKFEAYGINLEQKTLANGTASFSDSTAGFSGSYQVYVVYSGDSTYLSTQSAPVTVTIH